MTPIGTLRNTSIDTLRDVLTRLETEGAAIGHFNVADLVLVKAVIAAASLLEEILPDLDQVLVITVNPGLGHQHFLKSTLPKIRPVSQMIKMNPVCELGVDGGIDDATAPLVVAAGANVPVAGSSIFATSEGVGAAMETLRAAITQVAH